MLQVLLLLPMRSTALKVVTRLCELAQKDTRADSIQNKVSTACKRTQAYRLR